MHIMAFIKSRDIRIAAKREDGVEYLMKRFGFSTKEKLYERIRKILPSEADALIKNFDKKHRQYITRQENARIPQEPAKEDVKFEKPADFQEQIEVVIHNVAELEAIQEENQKPERVMLSIEELKLQEAELSEELCNAEGEHKVFVAERRSLCEDIAKARRAIEELLRLADIQNEHVQQLLTRYSECDAKMVENMKTQRALHELLDETRAQIVASEKIAIYVYQNGNLEVCNGDVPAISDEEVFSEFSKLLSNHLSGDITINEMKGVIKLKKVVAIFSERGRNYEIAFESENVKRVWESILA